MSAQILSQEQVEKIYKEMVEAATAKDFDKIRAFFDQEKNKDFINKTISYYGNSLFTALIQAGISKELIQFLIEKGADINYFPPRPSQYANVAERFSPLTAAIATGNNDAVAALIDNHVTVDAAESLPLQKAAETRNLQAIQLLIEHGDADVNFSKGYGFYAMDVACGATEDELIEEEPFSALMVAAKLGFSEIVEYLLKNNADIGMVANEDSEYVTVFNLAFAKKNRKEFSEIWEMLTNHMQEILYHEYRTEEGPIAECLKHDMRIFSGEASNADRLYAELERIYLQPIALRIYNERSFATASIPRFGKGSSAYNAFFNNPLYDSNLVPMIFSLVGHHQPAKEENPKAGLTRNQKSRLRAKIRKQHNQM